MSGKIRTKGEQAAHATKLVAGTQKHLSAVGQLLVSGGSFTPAQVEAQLAAYATLYSEVDAAKAVVKGKLAEERSKGPALGAFLRAFEGFVRAAFGGQPAVLADFGLTPKKVPTPLTVEQQAAAKAKRGATRKARGTVGKKKKLAIKGNVTGVLVTPITEPSPNPVAASAATNGAPVNGAPH